MDKEKDKQKDMSKDIKGDLWISPWKISLRYPGTYLFFCEKLKFSQKVSKNTKKFQKIPKFLVFFETF